MQRFRLVPTLTLAALACVSQSPAFSAAFQFYEMGSPIIGTAAVGQAALVQDASIAYYNPAGMVALQQSQFMVGTQLNLPYVNFSSSTRTNISGDNGGNAVNISPTVGMFYVYHYSPKLSLGVSFSTPYGGALNYNDEWVGRYFAEGLLFFTLNLNPAIAYRYNKWLAIGGGLDVEYAYFYASAAVPLAPDPDGQINIKTDNVNSGLNLGVLLTPGPKTTIGITYRSRITHDLHGKIAFLRLPQTPGVSTKMVMPQNIVASISQQLSDPLKLLGEIGWANWATMKNSVLHIQDVASAIPRNWHNTYRLGVGATYQLNDKKLLTFGISYDSSPTSASDRTPDLPMDQQIRIGLGSITKLSKEVDLGMMYEFIDYGRAKINNQTAGRILVGSYSRNFVNVFQLSLNVKV